MAGNIDILLVDDNPYILQLLQKGLSGVGRLHLATGAEQALEMVSKQLPDLVISDLNLPEFDGLQLFTELRSRPQSSRIPLILLASRAGMNQNMGAIRESIEEFIEKPFFLSEAVRRIKRISDRIALEKLANLSTSPGSIHGTLTQMSGIDLLQSLEMGHKTCCLTITPPGGVGAELYFRDGLLNHAVYGGVSGDEAVYNVLTLDQGNWTIDFRVSSPQQSVSLSTQGLLLEWLRRLDEKSRNSMEAEEL